MNQAVEDFMIEYHDYLYEIELKIKRALTASEEDQIFMNLLRIALGLEPILVKVTSMFKVKL